MLVKFLFKFQAIAEKTAKNISGRRILPPHPVYSSAAAMRSMQTVMVFQRGICILQPELATLGVCNASQ